MATSPPCQVEDQTDEDFFDKLVDDDEDMDFNKPFGSGLNSYSNNGSESDFANLGLENEILSSDLAKGKSIDFAKLGVENESLSSNIATKKEGFLEGNKMAFKSSGNAKDSFLGDGSDSDFPNLGVKSENLSSNVVLKPSDSDFSNSANLSIEDEKSHLGNLEGNLAYKPSGNDENSANLGIKNEDVSSNIAKGEEGLIEGNVGVLEKKLNSSPGSVIEHGGVESNKSNLYSVFAKSNDSPGGGVKEVQWDAFGDDTGDDGDFFSGLGDTIEQPQVISNQFVGSGVEDIKNSYEENGFNTYQENASAGVATVDEQIQSNMEYWENQYPGWKFDANTGQWYQIDGYDTVTNANVVENATYTDTNQVGDWGENSQISYLQQSSQSVLGAVPDSSTTESVSHLNQTLNESVSDWNEVNNGYPEYMVFDPQYPGWYYNTIAQEWLSLESYNSSVQSTVQDHDPVQSSFQTYDTLQSTFQPENSIQATIQPNNTVQSTFQPQNSFQSTFQPQNSVQSTFQPQNHVQSTFQPQNTVQSTFQPQNSVQSTFQPQNPVQSAFQPQNPVQSTFQPQNPVQSTFQPQNTVQSTFQAHNQSTFQNQDVNSVGSHNNHNQQSFNMWQPEKVTQSASWDSFGNQQVNNNYSPNNPMSNQVNRHTSFDSRETVPFCQNVAQSQTDLRVNGSQAFVPTMSFNQQGNQPFVPRNQQMDVNNNSFGMSSAQFQSSHQFSQASNAGRSSAGRPAHALVTFGFGGKLIVMKDDSSLSAASYGTQGSLGGTVSIFNMMEVVMEKNDEPNMGGGGSDYFNSLCKRSFPGPLVGGNVGTKELNKWIDEKILSCDTPSRDYGTNEVLKLLFSLLKIACQYYGKLRSPFGTEAALRENDAPESAVARLFASVKKDAVEFNNYNALPHCLQNMPSEEQTRANAVEVQRLLVSGKKIEALELATNAQLWGPALVLAAQLGDKYYCEAVRQMALRQLVAGSPLRTLCLLIAGQPQQVFSSDSLASSNPGAANMFPTELQHVDDGILDHWEENLAVIAANRTQEDDKVLVYLGDGLWFNRSNVIAGHICYLVADNPFEPYSDAARLCLIGADHLKCPRTFANPDAIQRTELYEYSKLLGNSQFQLLPFQPYKLVYAVMLAEVGKVTESLKYCQAVLKSLKTGRAHEVETLRQVVSSFEERLRTHQQGGFSSNLAPAKIVGKLLNLFDSTAHRVVGGLPPPIPSSQSSAQNNEQHYQNMAPRVSTSQSTMAMSSLMPSASTEPISEWTGEGNRMSMHNRSISEPDIGATPRQNGSSKETAQGKASSGASRFGRFGFGSQLLQKTVGLVMKPRQDKQAKLGETNKFYYDEKLKRWVEEGVDLPAEEAAPPPPPTTAAFQNGMPDYSLKNALKIEGSLSNSSPEHRSPSSDHSSGIPPIPTTSNQFSARGRMGVRSRYVDTFNKGGGNSANLFQSPAVPSMKPVTGTNPKFFVPSPVSPAEHSPETTQDIAQEATSTSEMASPPVNSSFPPHSPLTGMQRLSSNSSVSEISSTSPVNGSFPSPPSSVSMQRYPSMDNITRKDRTVNGSGLISSSSRRTASWSGGLNDSSTPNRTGLRPPGGGSGMPPSSFMPNDPSVAPLTRNSGSYGEDLHEVEL